MNRAKELYQKVKDLPEEEKNKVVAEYMEQVGEDEFAKQLLEFADDTQQELQELSKDTIRYKTRWLNEAWLNKSEIYKRLYDKSDKSTVEHFTQQRQGKKPWKPGQLERLDEIRKELIERLKV